MQEGKENGKFEIMSYKKAKRMLKGCTLFPGAFTLAEGSQHGSWGRWGKAGQIGEGGSVVGPA